MTEFSAVQRQLVSSTSGSTLTQNLADDPVPKRTAEASGAASSPAQNPAEARLEPAVRANLLIVEDNRADILLVQEAIRLHEVPVSLHVVEDGEEACAFIERAERDVDAPRPGLLLLDLNVPKKTGLEVLERVRRSEVCKDIPVVVFTSSNSPHDRMETTRLGANRYFQKPTRYDQFLQIGLVLKELVQNNSK